MKMISHKTDILNANTDLHIDGKYDKTHHISLSK